MADRMWPIWKPISVRFYISYVFFRPSYKTFYEEITHTSHFVVFVISFIQSHRILPPLKICLISQISVHSLWHVWIGCSTNESEYLSHALRWAAQRHTLLWHTCEPSHEKICLWGFATRPDSNQPAQLHRLARVLKFWIELLNILYYLCSEQ